MTYTDGPVPEWVYRVDVAPPTDPLRPPETDEEPWSIATEPADRIGPFLQVVAWLVVIVALALFAAGAVSR